MKIEILRENKLKIMLEPDDLKRWGIDASNVLNNEPHSRDMFVEILKRAQKETGFNCINSKLVVESAINSEKKQLTLYVTKVASEKDRELFDEIYHENEMCVIPVENTEENPASFALKFTFPLVALREASAILILFLKIYSEGAIEPYF